MANSPFLRFFYLGVGFVYTATTLWTTLLLWQTLALTHSALWVAMAAGSAAVPAIIVGITGPEWGFGGKMGTWLIGIGLGFLLVAPWLVHSPWMLLAMGLGEGWLSARVIPKAQAWLMSNVSPVDAPRVSARFEMASRIGMVAGPLVAGSFITVGGALVATLVNAGLFVLAGGVWYGLKTKAPATTPKRSAAWHALLGDGFLMTALGVRAGANLLWPAFTVAIPLLIQNPWHAEALGYGAVRTLWGLSTVLGTWILIPRLFTKLRLAYFLSWGLTGIAFWRIGLTPHLTTALVWVFIGALSSPIVHVALDSHIGTQVDASLQGGVFAIQRLVMGIVNLVGLFFITGVIRRVQPGPGLSDAGIAMGATAIMGLLLWSVVHAFHNQKGQVSEDKRA